MGASGVKITMKSDEAIASLRRIEVTTASQVDKVLANAALASGEELKTLMSRPQARDAFWGVMGGALPGFGRRSSITISQIVASGRVYVAPDGVRYSFVGHGSPHVAKMEDGGPEPGPHQIPTIHAQTRSGVDRYAGQDALLKIEGAFKWPTARMKNFKNGRPKHFWIARSGTGGKLELLYMLAGTVNRKPRRTFATLKDRMAPRIKSMFDSAAIAVVRAA